MSPRPVWTFISNHGAVLAAICQHGQITAREIAEQVGITERAVRRIIRDLETEGYVTKQRVGRTNRYEINGDKPLRRHGGSKIVIGDLLHLLLLER